MSWWATALVSLNFGISLLYIIISYSMNGFENDSISASYSTLWKQNHIV